MPQRGTSSHLDPPLPPKGAIRPPIQVSEDPGARVQPDPSLDIRAGSEETYDPGSVLSQRPDLAAATRTYISRGRVASTDRARRADWRIFESWCKVNGVSPLPATVDTIIAFLVESASNRTLATLRRYKSTISQIHGLSGISSPTTDTRVRAVLRGIAVEKTERPPNMKVAATADVFNLLMKERDGQRNIDIRDRALLLLGAVSGMRRAEIVAVNIEDLTWHDEGISILIKRSKTDQTGVGRYVAVPRESSNPSRCAVHAIRAWLDILGAKKGSLFPSLWKNGRVRATRLPARRVADLVQRSAEGAGLDPTVYGAHSLRSGYITQARREGLSLAEIMEQTGHQKTESVRRYARDPVDPFRTGRVKQVARAFAKEQASSTRSVEDG